MITSKFQHKKNPSVHSEMPAIHRHTRHMHIKLQLGLPYGMSLTDVLPASGGCIEYLIAQNNMGKMGLFWLPQSKTATWIPHISCNDMKTNLVQLGTCKTKEI